MESKSNDSLMSQSKNTAIQEIDYLLYCFSALTDDNKIDVETEIKLLLCSITKRITRLNNKINKCSELEINTSVHSMDLWIEEIYDKIEEIVQNNIKQDHAISVLAKQNLNLKEVLTRHRQEINALKMEIFLLKKQNNAISLLAKQNIELKKNVKKHRQEINAVKMDIFLLKKQNDSK